jgi:hypothetical protein
MLQSSDPETEFLVVFDDCQHKIRTVRRDPTLSIQSHFTLAIHLSVVSLLR